MLTYLFVIDILVQV